MMILSLGKDAYAQKISIDVRNVSLFEFFQTISFQTNINFIAEAETLDDTAKITLLANSVSIADFLKLALTELGLDYKLKDNICIIQKKKYRVNGKILSEDGTPMAGAAIQINKSKFVYSDNAGKFKINDLSKGDRLSVYYVSYKPKHILYNGESDLLVKLNLLIPEMDSVQVNQAYFQVMPKERITGSFFSISKTKLDRQVSPYILEKLEGRIPGLLLNVTRMNGMQNELQIRGQTSIGLIPGSSAYKEPLIVIDGIPLFPNCRPLLPEPGLNIMGAHVVSPLDYINPNDIECISILKGGNEAALYGSSGSNGVIVINTKHSIENSAARWKINFSSGIGQIKAALPMMNVQQYKAMRMEAFRNDNTIPTKLTAPDLASGDTAGYTDFRNRLAGAITWKSDLFAAVSGGKKNTLYYFSGSYLNETTFLPRTMASGRVTLLSHLSQKLAKGFEIDAFNQLTYSKNKAGINELAGYSFLPPDIPQTRNDMYSFQTFSSNSKLELKYKLSSSLDLSLRLGHNNITGHESATLPVRWRINYSSTDSLYNEYQNKRLYNYQIIEPLLKYNTNRKLVNYTFLLGAALSQTHTASDNVIGTGFNNLPISATSGNNKYNYVSCFSNLVIRLKRKYIASITYRRDGSNFVRANGRFGNFGALGGAWVFSDEPFFDLSPVVSYGKLRGSYGITGNDQSVTGYFSQVFPSSGFLGSAVPVPVTVTQKDYSWEKSHEIDLGLDLELFNRSISLSLDYYRTRTGNQIIGVPDAAHGLHAIKMVNSPAVVENKGLEVMLQLKNKFIGELQCNTSLTLTLPNNRLLSFPGLTTSAYANTLVVGRSLSVQQGYQFTGVNAATGLYEMADLNKDGHLDRYHDYKFLGDLDQRLYGSMNLDLRYHNLNLNISLIGRVQKGYNMLSQLYANVTPGTSMINLPVAFLNRWREPGDQTYIQRLSANNSPDTKIAIDNYLQSSARLVSASYLRLQYVNLFYDMNLDLKERMKFTKLTFFLSADNLFTFAGNKEVDPYTQNIFIQPQPTTVTGGVRISF